jgi:DNA-directed RNA polymerase specialized sigma24 family protein
MEQEVHQKYLLGQALEILKASVNDENWRVFQVRVLEARTTKEAAKILGKSEGSIDVTCSRMRLKLKSISDQLIRESDQLGIKVHYLSSKPL